MSKPKKNLEKARQIKGLGNSGLKKIFHNAKQGAKTKKKKHRIICNIVD